MKLDKKIREAAKHNAELAIKRAGVRCPQWARGWKHWKEFLKIYTKAKIKNRYKSNQYKDVFHVDHIIPLHGKNVSGLHVPWNLHILTRTINIAKGTLIVEEYGLRYKEPMNVQPWGGIFFVPNGLAKSNKYFAGRHAKNKTKWTV